jgi:hypothetical protein
MDIRTMTESDKEELDDYLLKDSWTISDACLLFAGFFQLSNGSIISLEHENFVTYDELSTARRYEQRWLGTDHNYADGATSQDVSHLQSLAKKTYIIEWAKSKQITLTWLDYAVEKGFLSISTEDLPETEVSSSQQHTTATGDREKENRLRLFSVLMKILLDSEAKKNFTSQEQLTDYIVEKRTSSYGSQSGLSKRVLNAVWAEANKLEKSDL